MEAPLAADGAVADAGAVTEECAICFDELRGCTRLPCSCNVAYCGRCWDRALARSFNATGQARCPTCRCPVRVDFDAEAGRLLFSREEAATDAQREHAAESGDEDVEGGGSVRERAVTRLARQALPAQIRLLRQFGTARPALQSIANGSDEEFSRLSPAELLRHFGALGALRVENFRKEALVQTHSLLTTSMNGQQGVVQGTQGGRIQIRFPDPIGDKALQPANLKLVEDPDGMELEAEEQDSAARLREAAGGPGSLASYWASLEEQAPVCVCTSALRRVSGKERALRFAYNLVESQGFPIAAMESFIAQVVRRGSCGVICDICDESVALSSAVWTCENGDSTILHATAYDVCETCFVRYAFGDGAPMPEARGETSQDD